MKFFSAQSGKIPQSLALSNPNSVQDLGIFSPKNGWNFGFLANFEHRLDTLPLELVVLDLTGS